MLIDTDVLIWYLRGNQNALSFLKQKESFFVSIVSYIELIQGIRNQQELRLLRTTFKTWQMILLPITEMISTRAAFYVEQHFLSHSLQLADALISATAVVNNLPLTTGNDKHYRIIRELEIHRFRP